jgi:hypothetical protein
MRYVFLFLCALSILSTTVFFFAASLNNAGLPDECTGFTQIIYTEGCEDSLDASSAQRIGKENIDCYNDSRTTSCSEFAKNYAASTRNGYISGFLAITFLIATVFSYKKHYPNQSFF